MKYQSMFNVWDIPADLLKHVQAGQMMLEMKAMQKR